MKRKSTTKKVRASVKILFACMALLIANSVNAQVTVTSFTPVSGSGGTSVTITGTNFNTTAASNAVYFGTAKGMVTAASATSLTVLAPSAATLDAITVINTGTGLAGRSRLVYTPTFNGTTAAPSFTKSTMNAPGGANLLDIVFVDLDGDGKNDMVMNDQTGHIYVYQNTTVTVGAAPTFTLASNIVFGTNGEMGFGDINNDGKPDIICTNGSNNIGLFVNTSTGAGNFSLSYIGNLVLPNPPGFYQANVLYVSVADFDGDGKQDILAGDYANGQLYSFTSNYSGGTISTSNFTRNTLASGAQLDGITDVALADLDKDGRPDIVTSVVNVNTGTGNYSGGYVIVYPNTSTSGSPSVAAGIQLSAPQSSGPTNVAIADFDGDGKLDVAWEDGYYPTSSNYVYVSRNTSTGTGNFGFATATEYNCGSNVQPYIIHAADMNGDGKPDIVVADANAASVNVLANTSTGTGNINFSVATISGLSNDEISMYAGDLNGDNKPDFASIDLLTAGINVFQNTSEGSSQIDFYSKAAGNIDVVTSWTTNLAGTGFLPPNFTTDSQVFHMANSNTGVIGSSNWTVSGITSKVVLDQGTDLSISNTKPVNATIDVAAGRKLTIANATLPTLGTLSSTSTVDYLNLSNLTTLSANTYGNAILDGTTLNLLNSPFTLAGTLTLQNSSTINNTNVSIQTKALVNTGGTISIGAAGAIDISGGGTALTNTGTISGAGTVAMTGTTNQAITGTGNINNLQINNAAGATISSGGNNVHITGALTMTSGTLTTNNSLTLVSNASGTARIAAITAGSSVSGNVTVQQYIQGNRAFRFLGHPFSTSIPLSQIEATVDVTGTGGTANGFTNTQTDNPSAFWYNTLTGDGSTTDDVPGWIAFTSTNGAGANAWNPYEGLRLLVRGTQGQGLDGNTYTPSPATISLSGPVNQGAIIISTLAGTGSGYNVLGNPYPSPTDIGTVINNAIGLVGPDFWVWDVNQGIHGAYVSQTVGGGAFYVPANTSYVVNAGTVGLLTFAESNKGATASESLLKTRLSGDGVTLHIYDATMHSWDRLSVSLNADASNTFEPNYDAKKLHNADLDFYSISSDNQKLCTDARPYAAGQIIPLGIATDVPQKYIIKAEDLSLPSGAVVYLHDKYLNTYQQLAEGSQYAFTITTDAASQGDNRFELGLAGSTTGIAGVTGANGLKVNMVPNPATEQVSISYEAAKSANTTLRITSTTGQTVMTMTLGNNDKGNVMVPLQSIAAGMYFVELTSGTQTVTQKLIKQ